MEPSTHHPAEFSLEFCKDVCVGVIWEVINHIKASMLHLLKNQRDLLAEGPSIECVYWGEHCIQLQLTYWTSNET